MNNQQQFYNQNQSQNNNNNNNGFYNNNNNNNQQQQNYNNNNQNQQQQQWNNNNNNNYQNNNGYQPQQFNNNNNNNNYQQNQNQDYNNNNNQNSNSNNNTYHGNNEGMEQQQQYADTNTNNNQQQQQQQQQNPNDGTPSAYEARWSWSRFPTQKIDAARMVVPLGCMFSPFSGPAPEVQHAPLKCNVCAGFLSCFATVDYRSKTWQCPLCTNKNTFPPQYSTMTQENVPAELMPEYQTIEYVLPNTSRTMQPVYVLAVDACTSTDEELEALKEVLLLTIEKLPPAARVCLITFSATVRIHELVPRGNGSVARSIVFRGSTEVTTEALKKMLPNPEYVVATLSEIESNLSSIINDLAPDQWPRGPSTRPLRCSGAAVSAATALLDLVAPKCGSCILTFLSGTCTEGPGQVAEISRSILIRGHNDLRDNTPAAKYYAKSTAFYDGLMRVLVKNGHALNVIMADLDQCGLAEMRSAVQATGGVVVQSDSWLKPTLRSSVTRLFPRREDGSSALALNVTIEAVTSPTWKVAGCAGQCVGTGKRSPSIADVEMGFGGTCQWTTSSMDPRTTFAFFFDPAALPANGAASPAAPRAPGGNGTMRYVQFITKFEYGSTDRVRVTTLSHIASETADLKTLTECFDQEAAAVLLARLAVLKADSSETQQVLSWLDRTTINFVKRFGDYVKDQPQSLKLSSKLSMFPLFVFHLRRSPYLQVFNSSPDETAIYRLLLLKSPTSDVAIMIHPTLFSYSMSSNPAPVALDTSALQPDTVLLLDTYFEILVYLNESIAAWKAAGYEENPEYAYFKEFLEGPRSDAEKLAADRFPAPRVIESVPNDGQHRILMNRINPAKPPSQPTRGPQGSTTSAGTEAAPVFTDDASWQSFLQQLKKVAVQGN